MDDYDTMHYAFVNINDDLSIDISNLTNSDFMYVPTKEGNIF